MCTCVHGCPFPQNGEILKEDIVLSIFDDNEPELAEYLTLRLVDAYGEAVLSETAVSGGMVPIAVGEGEKGSVGLNHRLQIYMYEDACGMKKKRNN